MGDLVLGIETSCDDTSVALVDQNGQIAAIETVSQYEVHSEFGGVYPELASRAHLEAILPTIETVMAQAGAAFQQWKHNSIFPLDDFLFHIFPEFLHLLV